MFNNIPPALLLVVGVHVIMSPSAPLYCGLTSEAEEGEEVLRLGLAPGQVLNRRGQGRGGERREG